MSAQETEVMTDGATQTDEVLDSNQTPRETLAPESEGQETPKQPELENDPKAQEAPQFDPESEQVIEFNGKTYTLKGKELQAILESQNALTEKEKSLNRDYTQKTQAIAQVKKSFESAFGKMPESQEIQNMGKLYQAYFRDPDAQQAINAILAGQPVRSIFNGDAAQGKESVDPYISRLESEINSLKGQLNQFVSGTEQEKLQAAESEGKRIFDSWVDSKSKAGIKLDESMYTSILDWAGFLRQNNPSMDANRALDEAYRHVNIDNIEKNARNSTFAKSESAKKQPTIKINPKSPLKADENVGYKDIFRSAM